MKPKLKIQYHKCGGCTHFQKIKGNFRNSGLCTFYDCRTDTDCGRNCKDWKGIRYIRNKRIVYNN